MSVDRVEAYLHHHIPLSAAMGVRVHEADAERVVLRVPLEPNLNHQSTAFGGSVAALGILAAWTLVHVRLGPELAPSRTVIQSSEVRYLAPVTGPFDAICEAPDPAAWSLFLDSLRRKGRARVMVETRILEGGAERATLMGRYVTFAGEAE